MIRIALCIASVLLLASSAAAAPFALTQYNGFLDWIPVIFAAILLSVMIAGLYYIAGAAIGSAKAKGQALSEMSQVVATAFIVVFILGFISVWNTLAVPVMTGSQSTFQNMCSSGYLAQSQLQFVNSQYSEPSGQPGPTNVICSDVIDTEGAGSGITANLDYGLGAAYVIAANLTNQSVANLDALYYFEGTIGWLRSFVSTTSFCVPIECAIPLFGETELDITYEYQPFQGYFFERSITPTLEIEATLVFYLYFLQLVGILIMLYIWPYLLAGGIILRTSFLTRRIGGLLIAIALVSLLIYPMITLIEFSTLSPGACGGAGTGNLGAVNNNPNCLSPIGATSLPSLVLCQVGAVPADAVTNAACPQVAGAVPYNINFYVLPQISQVLGYYDCYKDNGDLLLTEIGFSSQYLIPGFGAGVGLFDFFSGALSEIGAIPSSLPFAGIGYSCYTPTTIAHATISLINAYGVIAVSGFIIPMFTILMSISAIVGLSSLLGGDTNLIGLARFV